MTRVIGVVSGKGGVGKTTLVSNIGAILAKHFKKDVTIIDCNLTASHLALYLGMHYFPTDINKVLKNEASIEEAIYEHFSGAKVVPASLSWRDLEGVDIAQIKEKIKGLFDKTEIILLDVSPGLGREALAAMKASDEVLFVTTPYVPCVIDIVRCKEVVEELGIKPLGIVLNMVNKERYEMNKREIETLTGLPVIAVIPNDNNIHKCLALKTPVVLFDPKTKASREIFKLAGSLVGESYKPEGVITRILKKLGLR